MAYASLDLAAQMLAGGRIPHRGIKSSLFALVEVLCRGIMAVAMATAAAPSNDLLTENDWESGDL